MNEVIGRLEADGVFEELKSKWLDADENHDLVFGFDVPTPNGELRIAVAGDSQPFAYASHGNIVGYDIELMYMVCKELGYKPVLTKYPFGSVWTAVNSGKERVALGCITYSDEREELVSFTQATYHSGTIAVVLSGHSKSTSLFESLKTSFEKNLIAENRWKSVLRGLGVTIELSVMSILLGSVAGFLFSFMLRSKKRLVACAAGAVSTVLSSVPVLIILMILYYIVFAKTSFPAILIGVLGISADFANSVAKTLNTGIKAVDKGQIEAAEAMGYNKFAVFKKIIFPQAVNRMFGAYSGSVISLVKGTSIIGYIAVEDLTKITDSIRSLTFEAFFPLVFTAAIYFVISRIFVAILSALAQRFDPKHRPRRVKGVKYDD